MAEKLRPETPVRWDLLKIPEYDTTNQDARTWTDIGADCLKMHLGADKFLEHVGADMLKIAWCVVPCNWCDCWSQLSCSCCCFWPCCRSFSGDTVTDMTDPSVWQEFLQKETACPEEFRGVYWLYDNCFPETVVSANHAEWMYDEEEKKYFSALPMTTAYSRPNSDIGHAWACASRLMYKGRPTQHPTIQLDMKAGVAAQENGPVNGPIMYLKDPDIWYRTWYNADPGSAPGWDELYFIYQWRKILDKDGKPTKHWDDFVEYVKRPRPGIMYLPCWPLITCDQKRVVELRKYQNRYQLLKLPPASEPFPKLQKISFADTIKPPEQETMKDPDLAPLMLGLPDGRVPKLER